MPPLKLAVVGKNIGYSHSPFIHSAFAAAAEIDISYTIEDVGEGNFVDKINALQAAGFLGCNITVPYKEQAFRMAHEKTPRAMIAGAANTFLFKNKKIYADNTDGIGLVRDLTQNLGFTIEKKRILICGAGGAVRGILGPLLDAQPTTITLVNRSSTKDQILSIPVGRYEDLIDQTFNLIIDGTSLRDATLPLSDSLSVSLGGLVYDLKYSALGQTPTMLWGEKKGAQVSDGIGMLVEQAAEAFFGWTGYAPKTRTVIADLRANHTRSKL